MAGSGLGTFIFAPLVAYLIQKLGWRNTIWVLSAIILMCAAFGSLFRPLKSRARKIPEETIGKQSQRFLFSFSVLRNPITYFQTKRNKATKLKSFQVMDKMDIKKNQHI